MKENGFLDAAVSVEALATRTKNYTGAEIEGVCKAAASYAFERNIDKSNLTVPLPPTSPHTASYTPSIRPHRLVAEGPEHRARPTSGT
jgi:SpoVK/Ycf46/Vps4 family AAA+-type ATPase